MIMDMNRFSKTSGEIWSRLTGLDVLFRRMPMLIILKLMAEPGAQFELSACVPVMWHFQTSTWTGLRFVSCDNFSNESIAKAYEMTLTTAQLSVCSRLPSRANLHRWEDKWGFKFDTKWVDKEFDNIFILSLRWWHQYQALLDGFQLHLTNFQLCLANFSLIWQISGLLANFSLIWQTSPSSFDKFQLHLT